MSIWCCVNPRCFGQGHIHALNSYSKLLFFFLQSFTFVLEQCARRRKFEGRRSLCSVENAWILISVPFINLFLLAVYSSVGLFFLFTYCKIKESFRLKLQLHLSNAHPHGIAKKKTNSKYSVLMYDAFWLFIALYIGYNFSMELIAHEKRDNLYYCVLFHITWAWGSLKHRYSSSNDIILTLVN